PQFMLLGGLEMMGGFRSLVQRQDTKDRQRRVGQRFPLSTDLRGEQLIGALRGSVNWLCNNVTREWVYRLFRVEVPGREEAASVVGDNARLFMFLNELRDRDE